MLKSQFTDQKFVKVVVEFITRDGKTLQHIIRWPSNAKVFNKVIRIRRMCKRLGFTQFKLYLEKSRAVSSVQRIGGLNGICF